MLKSVDIVTQPAFAFNNEQTLPIEGFTVVDFCRDYDITPDGGCLRRSLLIGHLQLRGRDGNDRSRAPVHLSNERDRRGGVRHARVR